MSNQLEMEARVTPFYPEIPLPIDIKFLISRKEKNKKQSGVQKQRNRSTII